MSKKDENIEIPVVLGTAREGRESEKIARHVCSALANQRGVSTRLVDVRDFVMTRTIPGWEEHAETRAWKDIANHADGFIFVFPEYNRGYPGEFKMLLDSAYDEYDMKPAGIVSVSNGSYGGAAGAEAIKQVLSELGMVALRKEVRVQSVESVDMTVYRERIEALFELVLRYARVLKKAREEES